jgi:hypothetical protein
MHNDGPIGGGWRGVPTLLALGIGLGLALFGRQLPAALSSAAPEWRFSAGRAQQLLERIARHPHPVQSAEHECAREIIQAELARLSPSIQVETGRVNGVPLTNLLARFPGYDPTGTVLCVAHYDSVPTGPGAGDDGVGVSVWLEVLRTLRARDWSPRNDVVILLDDGEELGLLGAQLHVHENRRLHEVAAVVNLEAIGNGGPAILFQLGPRNAGRVETYRREVADPAGTSLAEAIYELLPNDTDLSVFLKEGIRGFNLALSCGSAAYHAPHDTPENLDPRSVQHMGESALALLTALGDQDLTPRATSSVSFLDLVGRDFLVWPRRLDAVLVSLALVATGVIWSRAGRAWHELARSVVSHGWRSLLAGLACALAFFLLDRSLSLVTPPLPWVAGNTTSAALLFAALVLGLAGVRGRSREEAHSSQEDALAVWSLGAGLALLAAPGASFALAVPALLAGAGRLAPALVSRLCCAAALAFGLPLLHLVFQLLAKRPELALTLMGAVGASGTRLFAIEFASLGRAQGRLLLFGAGLTGAGALFVARVLGWRFGALWP